MRPSALRLIACTVAMVFAWAARAEPSNWQESPTPSAPAWSKAQLVPIELPPIGSLIFGIDPKTVSVGEDEVVRYVVVAYNPEGSTNALYEGLRCTTGEIKTYARTSRPDSWQMAKNPEWRPLDPTKASSRHAIALARQSFCEGASLFSLKPADLIKRLGSSLRP